jgi:hypothetical protein
MGWPWLSLPVDETASVVTGAPASNVCEIRALATGGASSKNTLADAPSDAPVAALSRARTVQLTLPLPG